MTCVFSLEESPRGLIPSTSLYNSLSFCSLILSVKDNLSVTFIECKGYNPDSEVPDKHLERWLNHSIPVFLK